MATTFLHYPDSLVNIDTDFGSSWAGDEEPSYELDGSSCLPCTVHSAPVTGDRLDSESQRTVITESMSVTASDEEKLQLLNKNTELRRLNAELMKLNQQWDDMYHNATQKMHRTVRALQDEVQSLRHHSNKLSMKLEHEQNKKEFYETSLFQEIKRNQKMQDYVRHLEGILHYNTLSQRGPHNATENNSQSELAPSNSSGAMTQKMSSKGSSNHSAENQVQDQVHHIPIKTSRNNQNKQDLNAVTTEQDINQLKEQLQALTCQTEIYAADYKTEHTDRQRMKTENDKLRRMEKEMREQMLILEEQLKVYEDDFRKERCDKQVLQRLLKSRNSMREPVLVHRCNNITHQKGSFGDTEILSRSGSRREQSGTVVEK